jgi:preprotein translocase subunit SecG
MSTLATILNTLVVILAVLLIALILVQPSKSGGGFGSAFGGLGESVFGAQAMSHLSKLTVWCISIFFILTLASAIVAGHMQTADASVVEESSIAMSGDTAAAEETAKAEAAAAEETVKAEAAAAESAAVPEEKPAAETGN